MMGVLQDQLLSAVHTAGSVVVPLRKAIRGSVIIQQGEANDAFYGEVESSWKTLTKNVTGSKTKVPMTDVATTICGWSTHTQHATLVDEIVGGVASRGACVSSGRASNDDQIIPPRPARAIIG